MVADHGARGVLVPQAELEVVDSEWEGKGIAHADLEALDLELDAGREREKACLKRGLRTLMYPE